jgi:predicted metal-dependent TIM-barrel fold hydrolase
VRLVLDRGFWAGMTLYPDTKCTPQRACDILEMHGSERIWINSAGDWGHSDPLAVPELIFELRARGHGEATIKALVHDNPIAFFSQCRRFRFRPRPD